MEALRQLYAEHWAAWMRDRPDWLTDKAERKIRAAGFAETIDATVRDAERDAEAGERDAEIEAGG